MIEKFVIGPLDTNCWLYTDKLSGKCAVIDPAYPDERLAAAISGKTVEYILLTHAHIDHIYGLGLIKRLTGAKVVCHTIEAPALTDAQLNLYDNFHRNFGSLGLYSEPFEPIEADITVDTGDCITLGNTVFTAMHTPGHTSGSVSYFTDKEMFCGDFLFLGSHGRTDFETGSFSDMIDSYRKVCALSGDYIIYPGHQETTTLKNERSFNPLSVYLEDIL